MASGRDAFEFALKGPELCNLVPDNLQLTNRDVVGIRAWPFRMLAQLEQFTNGPDRETEVASVLDEGQPFPFARLITPLIAARAARRHQQTHLLIVADGRNFHPGDARQLSDRQHDYLQLL